LPGPNVEAWGREITASGGCAEVGQMFGRRLPIIVVLTLVASAGYVGLMRPDIYNDRAPPSVDPVNDWDAWTWAGHAQAEGLSVDGNPAAGDVMVWSRAR
jgi:hypothetical protein